MAKTPRNSRWELGHGNETLTFRLGGRHEDGLVAQTGSAMKRDIGVGIEGDLPGGIGQSVLRGLFTEDEMILSHFSGQGDITIHSQHPRGKIAPHYVQDTPLIMEGAALLASSSHLELDTKVGNLASILSQEAIFWIRASAESNAGWLFLTSQGQIDVTELDDGERVVIDTGHLLAYESSIGLDLTTAANSEQSWLARAFHSVVTKEGLMLVAEGPGKVYLKTVTTPQIEGFVQRLLNRAERSRNRNRK